MTQEQYERDLAAMQAEAKSFSGTPEDAVKFLSELSEKYSDVCKFNEAASACKDLEEFKALADSIGLKFSADEPAEKLFVRLQASKENLSKTIENYKNGAELDNESLGAVSGGGVLGAIILAPTGLIVGAIAGGKDKGGVKGVLKGAAAGAAGGALCGLMLPEP